MAEKYFIVYTSHFLYPLRGIGQQGWLHNVAIVNKAVRSMGVQASLLYADLRFFGHIPKSGIGGS
jgi:hypothetical protein